jgi:hypothetical protein
VDKLAEELDRAQETHVVVSSSVTVAVAVRSVEYVTYTVEMALYWSIGFTGTG